jgi:cytochrome oxidase assembly protein ShyY1
LSPHSTGYRERVLRSALWTLRQPRYQALAALAVVLALLCSAAGTWQIARFNSSVRDNTALRANAHAQAVPLTTTVLPLVGQGAAPGRDAIRYRTVTVTGNYLPNTEQYLRYQEVSGDNGYFVITPLRTADGLLLVARGFVANHGGTAAPQHVAAPPAGTVRITGRLQTPSTGSDKADQLGHRLIDTVNPAQQAARRQAAVFDGYLTLNPHQPGSSGLTALPAPDLSNPAGGAYEWQHFAYILQWYVFALLALALPFAMARHEVREARKRYLGLDPGAEQFDAEPLPDDGRPALPAGAGGAADGSALAVRESGDGTLARRDQVTPEQWRRAAALADRYGRSLGPDGPAPAGRVTRLRRGVRSSDPDESFAPAATAAHGPYRSEGDAFHGAYNDYLWELALADGNMPEVLLSPDGPVDPRQAQRPDFPIPEPRLARDDEPEAGSAEA